MATGFFLFFCVARPRRRLKLTKAMDSTAVLGLASDTDTPNDANGAKQQQTQQQQQSQQQQHQQQQHCNWLWQQQQQQEYKFSPFILASSHDLCEIIIGEFLVFTTRLLSAGRRHYNNLYTNIRIYKYIYPYKHVCICVSVYLCMYMECTL